MAYDAYAPRAATKPKKAPSRKPAKTPRKVAGKVALVCDNTDAEARDGEMFTPKETGETVAAAELRQFIERIERLEEEKAALSDDVKEVLQEAKGRGYDTKAIRTLIRMRKQDPNERQEAEAILETYKNALGMV